MSQSPKTAFSDEREMNRRSVLVQARRALFPVVVSLSGTLGLMGCATRPTTPAPVNSQPPSELVKLAREIGKRAWWSDEPHPGIPVVTASANVLTRARQRHSLGIWTVASHPNSLIVEMLCLNPDTWVAEDTYLVIRWQSLAGPTSRMIGPLVDQRLKDPVDQP